MPRGQDGPFAVNYHQVQCADVLAVGPNQTVRTAEVERLFDGANLTLAWEPGVGLWVSQSQDGVRYLIPQDHVFKVFFR